MNKQQRESNFELLRILAMIMIITLHLNGTTNALTVLESETPNYYISHFFESLSICSVNCFVLLSGYFMVSKNTAPVKKCILLLFDVAFWGIIGLLLSFLFDNKLITLNEVLITIVPYIKGQRWFVRDYIILMLLSPFLNIVLRQLPKRYYQLLLFLTLLFFSVWPSFFPNPPIDDYGFSCVHFIHLYLIAGYIKLHLIKLPKKSSLLLCFIASVIFIYLSALKGVGYAYAYNYLFTITASVSLFLLFRKISFVSTPINELAAGVFDVFIIHTTIYFADSIYIKLFRADILIQGNSIMYILCLLICPVFFYFFCCFLSAIKRWLFKRSVNKWIHSLPLKDYSIN